VALRGTGCVGYFGTVSIQLAACISEWMGESVSNPVAGL
jgi:hypothetical protein